MSTTLKGGSTMPRGSIKQASMIIPNTPQPKELGSLARTMKHYEKSNDTKVGLNNMALDKSNTPPSTGD